MTTHTISLELLQALLAGIDYDVFSRGLFIEAARRLGVDGEAGRGAGLAHHLFGAAIHLCGVDEFDARLLEESEPFGDLVDWGEEPSGASKSDLDTVRRHDAR